MTVFVLFAAAMAATGWWRVGLIAFRIRADQMTVDRLGLQVPAEHRSRIDGILKSFAGGFNTMIASPSLSGPQRYCDSLGTLHRPFAHEGAAMGYTLHRFFRYEPLDFEERIVHRHVEFCYLHYVGLGFWSGMRKHDPRRLARVVAGLDPLHGLLCYDGYGFKHAFFDYPKAPASLGALDRLDGYARNVAYQGVGRAFFFYHMEDPDVLIEHVDRLGDHARDAAGGVGLASVFIFPDRLEVALELAARMPQWWHKDVHVGMCFGLKARSINDAEQFARDLARLEPGVQESILAAIAACDRIEADVRLQRAADGYRLWRDRVSDWMASHIEYPLAALGSPKGRESKVHPVPQPSGSRVLQEE